MIIGSGCDCGSQDKSQDRNGSNGKDVIVMTGESGRLLCSIWEYHAPCAAPSSVTRNRLWQHN